MKFTLLGILGLWLFSASLSAADPALAQKWVAYGQQMYAQRQYDKAQQAFSTAARADSRNAAAWKGLGNVLYMKNDKANALKYYKYAMALNPSDTALSGFVAKLGAAAAPVDPYVAYADKAYAVRQYPTAATYYQQYLTRKPDDAKVWQKLGNTKYAQRDNAGAVEAYNKSLAISPNPQLQAFVTKLGGSPAGAAAVADGPTDWGQPLWRSAILPGWGQAYNGSKTKAWVLGISAVTLMGATVGTYVIGDSARQQYSSLTDPKADFDTPYATWESMANINHITYALFGAVYLYGLVDAVIDAKPVGSHRAMLGLGDTQTAALNLDLNGMGTPILKAKLLEF